MQRAEILKSSETVKISDLLKWGERDDIVSRLAERKVDSLSYQSFGDLIEYLRGTLGLPIPLDDVDISRAREGMEVRNISVHNALVVNSLFVKRTGRTDLVEGKVFPLTLDYVLALTKTMATFVSRLDAAFIQHFDLKFENYVTVQRDGLVH